jgi:hypothetical protein
MKRSSKVALVLLGSVGAAAAAVSWLSDEAPDGTAGDQMFRSIDDCRATYDDATCAAKYGEAKAEHERLAPKYATREACEQDIGPNLCTVTDAPPQRGDGGPDRSAAMPPGGWFIPAFAGFMIGRSLLSPAVPLHFGPPPPALAPDCPRTPDGNCRATGSGSSLGHVYYCGGSLGAGGVRTAAYAGSVGQSGGRTVVTSGALGGRAATGIANATHRGGFGGTGRGFSGGGKT